MSKKSNLIMPNRRGFLKTLAGASLVASNMFWVRSAFAADAPKRVIFVYVPDGAIPEAWHPRGSETSFTLPAASAPLESVKQHCIFLNGINMNNPGHGLTSKTLAGDQTTSLDIFMAKTLGAATPFSQIQLGVISNGHGSASRLNWSEPAYEDNPLNAFDRLFGAGAGAGTEDIATRKKRRVLDTNLEALNQLRRKLGGFEQSRLDEHTAAIEKIESRLTATPAGGGACTNPVFNTSGFGGNTGSDVNFEIISELQMDLIALAFKCDLTRVVSLMLGNHQADFAIPEADIDSSYHQSIHGRPAEDYIAYRSYFSERLRYLIQTLADTDDIDGSSKMIDNTIILQVSDMADGRFHSGDNAPYMLAGGGGGSLRRGRSLSFNGADYRDVLDTAAVAAGINIESGDYPGYGNGTLSGILS